MNWMTPRGFYVILQIISTVILICELIYVALQKPSNLQKHLIILLLTIGISNLGYIIELIGDKQASYIGIALGYFGKPFALLAALLLLLEYANVKISKKIIVIAVIFFLFLTTMVITNPWHRLYYKEIQYLESKVGSPYLIKERGIFWYVYMVSSFIIFALYSVVVFIEFKQSKTKQAKQMAAMLFLVVFFAFLGLIAFICTLTNNYDTTLLGIMIGTLIMLVLFTKYRLFDSITLSQQKALDETKDGVIVLDARMVLSFFNTTASKIFPELKNNMGRKNESILIDYIDTLKPNELIFVDDQVYSFTTTVDVVGKKNRVIGKTYTFKNITEHYHYQNELESEINKVTTKMIGIQRNALVSFADVVEARDGNTGDHIKQVSLIAYSIAKELQKINKYKKVIDNKFVEIIKECSPLHDIGKIYVPDNILLKPGKLTPEEFEIIKTHTFKGYEIIEKSIKQLEEPIYVKTCQDIALYHHEKWDGSGYPKGLKGEKIPLSARISAVADVYDALRRKRSYKEAYSVEKSIEIIKSESGTHFDPEIVEAFLRCYKKINL